MEEKVAICIVTGEKGGMRGVGWVKIRRLEIGYHEEGARGGA